MDNGNYLLEMINITKSFPGVKALSKVTLRVRKSSVHALMGENGAGKSTLMKILNGMYSSDEGQIIFNGKQVSITSTQRALQAGISMIHQEQIPIPEMSVADNIFMGRYIKTKGVLVDKRRIMQKTRDLFENLGIKGIAPNSLMKNLSVAQMQMVEIVKAVSNNAKLIIMDEPTSSLMDDDVERLFSIIKKLKENGTSIIYISHRIKEIFTITDEITILRDGETISTDLTINYDNDKLVKMMVGRELKDLYNKIVVPIGEKAIEVRNLTGKGYRNISFDVKKGEILGFAGLVGAGRSELVESIFGIRPIQSGEIIKNGKRISIRSSEDAIKNGIALATEDRKQKGLMLSLSVAYNISLVRIKQFAKAGLVNRHYETSCVGEYSKTLGIKASSSRVIVNTLSGGNQQKVVLAKWLAINPDVLILDEPTRGIDVGAKAEIYKIMEYLASQGKAIIMISSELPEIIGMSDRIIIMHEGKISGEIQHSEATQEKIGRYFGIECT